jgi:hypothetical protein
MDAQQIETELEDLETRIDRLRGLYDQYFMGIERMEPAIPRKDVERKIQVLRKEQIRNTGMRFKFNTLVQRFNTMQQYWGRISREIENGTYKRDVIRAAERIGAKEAATALGRRRAEKYAHLAEAQKAAKTHEDEVRKRSLHPAPPVEEEEATLRPPPPAPSAVVPAAAGKRLVPAAPGSLPDADAGRRRAAEIAAEMKRKREAANAAAATASPLALDGMGDAGPAAPPKPRRPSGPPPSSRRPPRSSAPKSVRPERLAPTAPGPAPLPRELRPPPPPLPQRPPGMPPPLPAPRAPGVPPPVPVAPARAVPPPTPSARAAIPPPPPAAAVAAPPDTPSQTGPLVGPRPARPVPPPTPSSDGDPRLRQIYAQYVDAKRKNNESTAGVTFDKLAKSLSDQRDRLRAQHGSKSVDFEVAVKDGRAVIRPILR